MEIPSSEIMQVIYALLPGFVTAWVFYALTAHPRLSPFERIVQALIFTGIVQAIVLVFREAMILLGGLCCIGNWTAGLSFVLSIIIAVFVGLLFALFANKNWFHKWLQMGIWFRRFNGVTKRTSFPSEWYSAFNEEQRYIVLHLWG